MGLWRGQRGWSFQSREIEKIGAIRRESSRDLQRGPLLSAVDTDQCVHVMKLPKARKRTTKKNYQEQLL